MSNLRYIEFDSTYRNRKLFPLPSVFEINMGQSGTKDKLSALDPVSDASPSLVWNSTFEEGKSSNYIDGIVASPVGPPSTTGACMFQITTALAYGGKGKKLRQVKNFYIGANLSIGSNKDYPPTAPITVRRIIDYSPLNDYNALVTLESGLPDCMVGEKYFYIQNPTPLDTTTPNTIIKVYIPGSNSGFEDVQRFQNYGYGGDNYYINYYVENTDTSSAYDIVAFDSVTRLATLNIPTDIDWATTAANFAIRKGDPEETGAIYFSFDNVLQIISDLPTDFARDSGEFDGDFLRIRPSVGTFPPWQFPTNEERRICKFISGSGGFETFYGPSPYSAVCLDSNAPDIQDAYKNCVITLATIVGSSYTFGASSRITYYGKEPSGPCKRYALLDPPIAILPTQTWLIRTIFLCDPFTVTPSAGALYELEEFTRDNAVPFNWTGSLITTSEVVCYEVELCNLILPNTTLASGRGGRLIFYPFLYCELSQLSATSGPNGTKGILSSNNPNAFRMLYRAILSDTPAPASSPFIKIDGDGMLHSIKFKPTDNFRFGVYHQDGEPIKTVIDEQFSPTEANALAQVSACFSFRRIS